MIEAVGDGYFHPVMVEVGITAMGQTEILKGLTVGQQVVHSGQFMIDAESNLRGGIKTWKDITMNKSFHVHDPAQVGLPN